MRAPRPTNRNGRTCKRPVRPQGVRRIREASSPVAVQKALPTHPVSRKVPRLVIARLALQAVAISCRQLRKSKGTRGADCRVASLLAMTRMGDYLSILLRPASGDVCGRRRWRMQRAKRSGSGQNLKPPPARHTIFGHRNRNSRIRKAAEPSTAARLERQAGTRRGEGTPPYE